MHVEVCLYLTPLLREEHRQQESGAEHASQRRKQARARAGPERPNGSTVIREQLRPDLDVPVLDGGQAQIEVPLLGVSLRARQYTIQVRGVGLVLPMMLEGVQVGDGARCWLSVGMQSGHGTIWRYHKLTTPMETLSVLARVRGDGTASSLCYRGRMRHRLPAVS